MNVNHFQELPIRTTPLLQPSAPFPEAPPWVWELAGRVTPVRSQRPCLHGAVEAMSDPEGAQSLPLVWGLKGSSASAPCPLLSLFVS